MADEFKILTSVKLTNGLLKTEFSPGQLSIDQAGALVYDAVHDIGTTEESITAFGDIANEGICVLYNLDTTNFVQVGKATTSYFAKLKPSHIPAIFNMNPATDLFLKADTAACKVRVMVFEE